MTTPPPAAMPPPPSMPAPAPKQRPVTVTAASAALMLIGLLSLISTVISLGVMGSAKERFREAAEASGATDTIIEQTMTFITIGVVIGIVLNLVIVIAIAVLALFNLRGNNVTRIITWVVAGLLLLCNICGVAGQGLNNVAAGGDAGQALNDATANMYPGWYTASTLAVTIIQALSAIAVIVLLALPQSNEFFRKAPPSFQPPVGG